VVTLAAPVAAAQAEQCSADGTICLLTEATAEHPYLPPQGIQIAVDSSAQSVGASIPNGPSSLYPKLVTAGPPGGMSIWEATLPPLTFDGPIALEVRRQTGSFPPSFVGTTFSNLPLLGTAIPGETKLQVTKSDYIVSFGYTARRPITLEQTLYLTTQPYKALAKDKFVDGGVGTHTSSLSFPVKTVKQFCQQRETCILSMESSLILDISRVGGSGLSWQIKTPLPPCLERIRRLERRRAPGERRHRYLKRLQRIKERRCYSWKPRVWVPAPSAGA